MTPVVASQAGAWKQAQALYASNGGAWVQVPLGTGADDWTRPTDWLATNVGVGEQKAQCLVAVGADPLVESNRVVTLQCVGAYTVNWGDGTAPQNFASNVGSTHLYDPAALAGTMTSDGFLQALITITPQAGNLITVNLSVAYYSGKTWRSPVVEVVAGSSALTTLTFGGVCPKLRRVEFKQPFIPANPINEFLNCSALREIAGEIQTNAASVAGMFSGCSVLAKFPTLTFGPAVTNVSSLFLSCYSMTAAPVFASAQAQNWTSTFANCYRLKGLAPGFSCAGATNTTLMFSACPLLETLPLLDTALVTTSTSMFANCTGLRTIAFTSTAAMTTVTSMFNGCAALENLTGLDFSNVSSAANLATVFASCFRLAELRFLAGKAPKFTWTVIGQIDAAGLNAIYTALPTVTAQTITVTSVAGTLADDPTIATAKGWTVTGS